MRKRYLLSTLCVLAIWSSSYTSVHNSHRLTVGSAANASKVRWTPNPDRGSASSTMSGGRRGTASATCASDEHHLEPTITLLVPEETVAFTTKAQPTLVWYVEGDQAKEMEFVLFHPERANPVYVQEIQPATGLIEVTLPESAALEVGVSYRWTVLVACDHNDLLAHTRSLIERVEISSEMSNEMLGVEAISLDQASLYASQGIWYDALNSLIGAYRQDAQTAVLQELYSLLQQANTEVPMELSLAVES